MVSRLVPTILQTLPFLYVITGYWFVVMIFFTWVVFVSFTNSSHSVPTPLILLHSLAKLSLLKTENERKR